MEYAGVVAACGPDCKAIKVGDRVCGVQDVAMKKSPGTWTEQTMAPEGDVVAIPAGVEITFVEAAAVGMGALVAGDMYKRAKLATATGGASQRCLVLGASGGLGTALLKLLRQHPGARPHVTAVCRGANAELVRRLGADEAVDYQQGPFGEQLSGAEKFDLVFDFVGGKDTERGAMPLLKRGGKFITAVGPLQAIGDRQLSCGEWFGWCCGLTCSMLACCGPTYEMAGGMPPLQAKDFAAVAVDAGVRAEVALELPFAEAPLREALRRVASRHTGGKVVINMERE